MSGHSKWANIKHKKEASDKKKGKVFSKLAKEIMVCVKQSGKDPDNNPRLRLALIEARSANMPRENIDRAIKKGAGELGNVNYEEVVYEGYGPEGTAFIVECLTDNKNRTIGDVRVAFDRNNGNLAASGAVSWMFQRKSHFVITDEANADEEKLMDIVLEAGADDIVVEDGVAEIWGAPEAFADIAKALEDAGIETSEAAIIRKPDNVVEIKSVQTAQQVLRLVDRLEELEDVQNVHQNSEIPDEIMEQVEEE
ncbi:MAG: YebC/PmpR family DNA-binding transcriptional regulator [Lentisphaeria bacterium]|nr:YebC/PmpR family DNA-binding transcriptional regulator [Lentisphaeria bacterium]